MADEKLEAELIIDESQFAAGIDHAVDDLKGLERAADSSFSFIEGAARSLDVVGSSLAALNLDGLAGKFRAFADTGVQAIGGFLSASGQVEQFQGTLRAFAGSTEAAQKEYAKLAEFAGSTPFELPDVVAAGVQLRTLGVEVDRFLPLAGDLASLFNRSIPDAARALGKALSGSQDGITVLQDSFGITKRELKAAGATMKSSGAVALDTSEDLAALATAIEKVASQKNFTGATAQQLETLSGKYSQLSDAIFKLQTALGDELAPAAKKVTVATTDLVNFLATIPGPLKTIIAVGGAASVVLAGIGAAFLGALAVLPQVAAGYAFIAANVGTMGAALSAAGALLTTNVTLAGSLAAAQTALATAVGATATAFKALAVSIGPVVLAATAIVAGFALTTKAINDESKALEELIALEERRKKALRENKDVLGKTAQELRAAGVSSKDLNDVLGGLLDQVSAARDAGNVELQQSLEAQVRELRKQKGLLSQIELDQGPVIKPEQQKEVKKNDKELKTEAKEREKARKENLADHLLSIRLSKDSADKKIADLKRVLKSSQLEGSERRSILTQIDQLEQQAARSKAQSDRKAKQDQEKKTREEEQAKKRSVSLSQDALALEKEAVDARIEQLEKQAARGKDVAAEQEAAIKRRIELEKQAVNLKFDQAVEEETDTDNKATLESNRASELGSLRKKEAKELEDLAKQNSATREAENAKVQALEGKTLDLRIQTLKQELSEGKKVQEELKQAIQQRLDITIQAIRSEAEAQKRATDSVKERIAIEKLAEAEISAAKAQAKQDTDAATKSIQDQKQAVEDLKKASKDESGGGKVLGLEDVLGQLSGQFGIDAVRARADEQNKAAADREKERAARFQNLSPTVADTDAFTRTASNPFPIVPLGSAKKTAETVQRVQLDMTLKDTAGKVLAEEKKEVTLGGKGSKAENRLRSL